MKGKIVYVPTMTIGFYDEEEEIVIGVFEDPKTMMDIIKNDNWVLKCFKEQWDEYKLHKKFVSYEAYLEHMFEMIEDGVLIHEIQ